MAVVHLLSILLAMSSGEIRRCALPDLAHVGKSHPTFASLEAPRRVATTPSSYVTDHFVIWWSQADSTHRIQGAAAVDSGGVPKLVRVVAEGLEKAWRGYVDTLKYLPPKSASTGYLWRMQVPAGKYPVEICDVGAALSRTGSKYFGVAYPDGSAGRSALMLASNLPSFGGWGMDLDRTGGRFRVDYSIDWRAAIQATAAHELFHAVQFNYELALNEHSFFESSAVAMESRMVPESGDYLQYAQSLSDLRNVVPFPTATNDAAYPHGWFVRTMMTDLGQEAVRGVWESRKATAANPPSFLTTMRQILPNYAQGSFDSLLIRQAMRLALTGKRSGWVPSQIPLFSDAAFFPTLTGTISRSDSLRSLPLALGAVQVLVDTTAYADDRLFVWIPDQGVLMGQAANTASGTQVSWRSGSVRVSPSEATRSAWAFANPGNPPALRAHATGEGSTSHYRTIAAPTRTAMTIGQKWTWASPGGPILAGTSKSDAQATPLLHVDVWKPSASKDPFAYRVAGGANGHALVLEDADRVLKLADATLSWAGETIAVAYQGSGDGVWKPLAVTDGVIALGDLDLARPTRLLVSATSSAKASVRVPRPNPSRLGESIRFPISGAKGGERLSILAADGGIVRELRPEPGQTEVVWNLRNRENRTVKPGVYNYVWRGIEGANHGRLLVAE
jgi:hypothetical protein